MDDKPLALTGRGAERSNGSASPSKLREQIEQTRKDMSGTIEQLHGRLNPVVLKEQALEQFHEASDTVKEELKTRLHEARETLLEEIDTVKAKLNDEIVQAKAAVREATIGKVENMMHSAKQVVADNPIPAALTGLGLAWLFIEGRRSRSERITEAPYREPKRLAQRIPRVEEAEEVEGEPKGAGEKVREVAHEAGEKARDVAGQAREKVREAGEKVSEVTRGKARDVKETITEKAHEVKETITDVAHKAQGTASDLSQRAGRQARRAQRRGREMFRDNPIAIGAAMLALGTLFGLIVPRTEREDEWIGGKRDQMLGKAQELTHEAFQKAGEAIKHAGEQREEEYH